MEHPLSKPKYITIHRAAELMAVHPNTIRRWIDGDILPANQIGGRGGRVLIALDDIHQLIEHGAISHE